MGGARGRPFFFSIFICWGGGNSVCRPGKGVAGGSEIWLGGLDSNQDSQIQSPAKILHIVDSFSLFLCPIVWFWSIFSGFCSQVVAKYWGEPVRWHNFFGRSLRFYKSVLASSSRRR